MSLGRRVLLGFCLVAVALVLTNVALASAFENDLLRRTDEELVETANRPVFAPTRRAPGRGPGELEPLSDLYIAVANRDGTELTQLGERFDSEQSPPAPTAEELRSQVGEPFSVDSVTGGGRWRLVALDGKIPDGLLVVATELGPVEATLRRMWTIQLVGSTAVLAALAAVLWWVLRLGVRPLDAMAVTALDISAGDLTRRVGHIDERTEAGRLGVAFNSMLDGIEDAIRQRDETADRLRQFAADASHELRTPLTSILGYADLWLAGGLRGDGELDQAMGRLAEEGRRMGALVEDLLLLARLDQVRPLERHAVRLDLLAADSVTDALAVEPDRPITIESEPVTIDGDEQRLRQVLANLLTNTRVHTPAGTPVHVVVSADGETARLEVADDGPGLSAGVADRVFERFYRGDRSRVRRTGGTGLGLSIVDAIVRAHGGRASVESTPGRGSRFVIELPRHSHDAQRAPRDLQGPDANLAV